jgi:hypothetical protein
MFRYLDEDSEGWLRTKIYDKKYDFNFPIVNFPFICSTCIWSIYLSVEISRLVNSYKDFPDKRLTANKEATEPRVHIG